MQRDQFAQHELAKKHLLAALMSIFVDIEHTGESMEFEDKFGRSCYAMVMLDLCDV